MSTSLPSPTATHVSAPAASVQVGTVERPVAAWGPLVLLCAALAYVGAAFLPAFSQPGLPAGASGAVRPLELFAIGLAPMIGAALAVWFSRQKLSSAERRARLVGAAMSAVLFIPALLLGRIFG